MLFNQGNFADNHDILGSMSNDYYQNIDNDSLTAGDFVDIAYNDPRSSCLGVQLISFKENNLEQFYIDNSDDIKVESDKAHNYNVKRIMSYIYEV